MSVGESIKSDGSKKTVFFLWFITGIPVFTGLLQGLAAFIGFSWSDLSVVGWLAELVHTYEPFRDASSMPMDEGALIALLFIQVGVCWVLFGLTISSRFGIANYGKLSDGIRSGTAFLIALIYFNLFVGVYGGIIGEFSTLTLIPFFSIPIIVVGAISGAWYLYQPRGPIQDIQRAKAQIDEHIRDYKNGVRNLQTGIDFLEETEADSHQVQGIDNEIQQYGEELEEIRNQIKQEMNSESISASSARTLLIRTQEQNPESKLREFRSRIMNYVVDLMKKEHGNFAKVSRYGKEYELVSHDKGPTIYLDPHVADLVGKQEINLGEISDSIDRVVDDAEIDSEDLFDFLQSLGEEYREISADIDEKEELFETRRDSVKTDLNGFEKDIRERFPNEISTELRRIYYPTNLDGDPLIETIRTARDVESYIDRAKNALHKCDFDEAFRLVDEAQTVVDDYHLFLEDLSTVTAQLHQGEELITLVPPDDYDSEIVNQELYERLEKPIQDAYEVDIRLSDDQLSVEYADTPDEGVATTKNKTKTDDPAILIEDGESVLNQVRLAAKSEGEQVDEHAITVNKNDLPEHLQREELLETLEAFLHEQPKISNASLIGKDKNFHGSENMIELNTNQEYPIRRVLEELPAKYANWVQDTQPNP